MVPLHILTVGVAVPPDAEAREYRSTCYFDTRESGDDPEALAMDAKSILEDDAVAEVSHEAWNGATRFSVLLMMGTVHSVKSEAVGAMAWSAGGVIEVCNLV